ncbi:MAG: M28 family peptidase [Thermogutta sp.]
MTKRTRKTISRQLHALRTVVANDPGIDDRPAGSGIAGSALLGGLFLGSSFFQGSRLRWLGLVVVSLILAGCAGFVAWHGLSSRSQRSRITLDEIPVDGRRAYEYLETICKIGPRPSGSPGMTAQQELLAEHFQRLGAEVSLQRFTGVDPRNRAPVNMANFRARFFPEREERILLCAHYDTLPFPLRDRINPRGRFVGANDGGSGVALLMELAHHLDKVPEELGIDIVFFDAEEFIFSEWDPYFQGSEFFARDYVETRPQRKWRYRAAVLVDMTGDADLQIYQERNSAWWKDSRWIVDGIWGTAKRLGVSEFVPQKKYEIRDDHLALHNIAGIPAVVLIDFDYPYWHTQEDTPDKCSPLSLAKVGWVLLEWLSSLDVRKLPAVR